MFATILARLRGMVSTPEQVETASMAEQLFAEITQIAVEQNRKLDFGEFAAAFCPVCAARRKAKAAAQRRWRHKRRLMRQHEPGTDRRHGGYLHSRFRLNTYC
jgi:hypothetical protein